MVHRAVDLGNSEEEWEVCKLEGTASIYQRLGSWHSRRQSSSVLIHCTLPGSKGGPPGSKGPHPEVKVLHSEVKVLHSEVKVLCCVEPGSSALEIWNFPGKNTGAGCYFLLQGIFLTQGLKLRLL